MRFGALCKDLLFDKILTISAASGNGYTNKEFRVVTKIILRVMQLTAFLMLCFSLQLSAVGFSQTITLSVKDVPLDVVFKEIKKQSGYLVSYNASLLKKTKPVTVSVKDHPFEDFIKLILSGQNLTYIIKNRSIIISSSGDISPRSKEGAGPVLISSPPITVHGKVLNEKGDGVNASIIIKGTKSGTTTDNYGNFVITNVDDNAILIISGIYIETQEIKVSGRTELIVATVTKIVEEEAIVKTNYYSTTKRLSAGNISKVTAKEIGNQPVVSPLLALQGRVPGVEITMPANAVPGVAPTIRIRGNNSLRMSKRYGNVSLDEDGNYPLYVIDGVPVDASPVRSGTGGLTSGGFDPLSTINPMNIESIEILKDGDATAIYGSRGANGVILITTKQRSQGNDRMNVDINLYTGIGRVSNKLQLLNTEQYLAMRNEALSHQGLSIGENDFDLKYWDATKYTDWQQIFLGGSAAVTDVNGYLTFNNKNTSFRIGGGFHSEGSVLPGETKYNRASGQASINHHSVNQRLKAGININYGFEKNNLAASSSQLVVAALTLAPNAPKLYNDDGSLNWELRNIQGNIVNTWINPLAELERNQKITNKNLIVSSNFNYELIRGLSLSLSMGYTDFSSKERHIQPISSWPPNFQPITGTANFSEMSRSTFIAEPKISYLKNINDNNINIVLGATWLQNNSSSLIINASEYQSDILLNSLKGAGVIRMVEDGSKEYRYQSLYARIGYNWKQKYIINLTGRRDGSSRFAPNKRFGNFGALGLAWIFSEEPFINEIFPFLSMGKLRASYGITGSDAVGDYAYYNLFEILGRTQDRVPGVIPYALYNPDFVWAATKKLEFGLELAFFDNRFGIELSWYRNRSSNQLVDFSLPYTTGFSSVLSNFDATVQNTGFETVIYVKPIVSSAVQWNISFNVSVPNNKLIKFDDIESSPYVNQYKVGEPLSIQWLFNWKGVNQQTGLHEFVDENKDGKISDLDRILMNSMDPRYFGGINNSVQWKNIDLSIQFQFFNGPGSRYLPDLPGRYNKNQPVNILNRWYTAGDQTDIQRFATDISLPGATNVSDAYIAYLNAMESTYNRQDASFVRLKSLALSYSLNTNLIKKLKLQQMRLFMQAQNLLTFTSYEGLDPETGAGLPPLRMLTTGIQVRF